MELQWPLIIFSTFLAWSAGLFATQGVYALKGEGAKAQLKALIVSVVVLAIGGIAVFFHLQHWERIFNGFGHLTSGITQELIAIVVMFVIMVIFFAMIRQREGQVPKWVAVLAIISGIALLFVCGHSYMMPARPAWDNAFQILSIIGAGCILGPATFSIIEGAEAGAFTGLISLIGSIVNGVLTVAYLIAMNSASFTEYDSTYFDPTQPTKAMVDVSSLSVFSGDALPYTILAICGAVVAIVAAFMGKKQGNWKVWGSVAVVAALVAAITLRMVFYVMGVSVYAFYN